MSARTRFDERLTAALIPGRWLHRIWWQFSDHGRSVVAWRPMCWLRGYHVPAHTDFPYYESCVWCLKLLWSKRRDGGPNPFMNPVADRAPLRRRRGAGAGGAR